MAVKLIKPTWPAPSHVQAFTTTRIGGISKAPYDSLNLALHVNDNPLDVAHNRKLVEHLTTNEPRWLNQTHSDNIAFLDEQPDLTLPFDGSVTTKKGEVCVVMTADCLPILITNKQGSLALAIHAGWQGLVNRIIPKSIVGVTKRFDVKPRDLLVWLGPAISRHHFEIGTQVKLKLQASMANSKLNGAEEVFVKGEEPGKWYADVYQIATLQLLELGVEQVFGGDYCTYEDEKRFYSHRRATHQGLASSGRMASIIILT